MVSASDRAAGETVFTIVSTVVSASTMRTGMAGSTNRRTLQCSNGW